LLSCAKCDFDQKSATRPMAAENRLAQASSIKLMAVIAAGPQFGPPGYERNLLYLACLATLVLRGSGPLAIDGFLKNERDLRSPEALNSGS
jgi:hypothetical protein